MTARLFRKTFFIVAFAVFFFGCLATGAGTAHAFNCVATTTAGTFSFASSSAWTSCGSGTPQTTSTITIGTSGVTINLAASTTVSGITISSGATLATNGANQLTDLGTSTIPSGFDLYGTLSGTGAVVLSGSGATIEGTGTPSYSGLTTITGTKTITSTSTLSFAGALTVSAAATTTNNGTITVAGTVTVTGGVSNNGTFTASGTLTGTGVWVQGIHSTLNATGGTTNALSITTVDASTNVNTVNYTLATAQTVKNITYQNLTFSGGGAKTCTSTSILGNLIITGTAAWTMTATSTLGQLNITGGTLTTASGFSLTVNGTTTIPSGTLTVAGANGTKTFIGLVTVNGGTLSGTAGTAVFEGGITQNNGGTVSMAGSTENFTTNNQSLNASGTLTMGTLKVGTGGITLTNNANVSSSGGTLTLTGNWTQGLNSGLEFSVVIATSGTGIFNATSNANTVTYDRAGAQTCLNTQYWNLTFGGASGAKTCTAFNGAILGNLNYLSGGNWTMGVSTTVSGNFTFSGSGSTVATGAFPFTVNGTTTMSAGTFSLSGGVNVQTFVGLVTVNGATVNGAGTGIVFNGGITQTSGSVGITGGATFATSSQALSGTIAIATTTIGTGITLTNNGTFNDTAGTFSVIGSFINNSNVNATSVLSVAGSVVNNGTFNADGNVTGGGSWTQGSNSTLLTAASTTNAMAVTTVDFHSNINTVDYNGTAQTCKVTQYYNLTLDGSGAKTCSPSNPILNNLTVTSTASWTLGGVLTVNGNFTIANGSTFDVSGSNFALNLNGNFSNGGTFNAENGTTTFSGTNGTQTATGTMTGTSSFYNLAITNSSGTIPTGCGLNNFTPSVSFGANATVNGNYRITTGGSGNVDVQYMNGSTYSFNNINWVGPASTFIYFRSAAFGSQWFLNVSGTQSLAYVNVSDSNASSGPAINASNVKNRNCGNDSNWTFATSTSPVDYTQAAYQLFANQNSIQPGTTLAGPNTSTTLTSTGEQFRMRMLLAVDATDSIAGTDTFTLDYAAKGGSASCAAVSPGAYAPITNSTPIAYWTNAGVTDGTSLVGAATTTDPTDGGRTVEGESYQSGGTFPVNQTIFTGQDGNWDFSLYDDGSPGATDYCFETFFSSSTQIYAEAVFPEVQTYGVAAPVISNPLFANGSTTIVLSPGTTQAITMAASTTAGGSPIAYATSTIYRTSRGANCTANNQNCYQIPSSSCAFSNGTTTVTCTANIWYFADSTTDPSSSYPSDSWTGALTVVDSASNKVTATSTSASMGILAAIGVVQPSINYGILAPLQTSPTNVTTTVQNVGNCSTTIKLSALTSLKGGLPVTTLPTSSQQYGTTTGFAYGTGFSLSSTPITLNGFVLAAPISTTSVQGNLFWGLQIASGSPTGTYNGTTTFSALFSQ
jgi:hypothetical protein